MNVLTVVLDINVTRDLLNAITEMLFQDDIIFSRRRMISKKLP